MALLPLAPGHTRGDCGDERPCAWECRYRLEHGEQSCALDVADGGPSSLEEVGLAFDLTRERVRQIEKSALAKLQKRLGELAIDLSVIRD